MTHGPMGAGIPPGFAAETPSPQPQRTSVLAVMGLVLGILSTVVCCIPVISPGVAVVGLICAFAGLVLVSGSQGRLRGKGAAITGIVLGFVGLVLGSFVTVGFVKLPGLMVKYGDAMTAAETVDPTLAQAVLAQGAMAKVDQARLTQFRDEYRQALGAYQEITPTWGQIFAALSSLGRSPDMQRVQQKYPGHAVMALPARFEKGKGVVLIVADPRVRGAGTPYVFGPLQNIGVTPDGGGAVTWLVPLDDPSSGGTSSGPKPPG